MKVRRETILSVEMGTAEAAQLGRSLSRVLGLLDKLPADNYAWLVDTNSVNPLLELKASLSNAQRADERAGGQAV